MIDNTNVVWVTGRFAVLVPEFTPEEVQANNGLSAAEWHASQITTGDVTFTVDVHGDDTIRVPEDVEVLLTEAESLARAT